MSLISINRTQGKIREEELRRVNICVFVSCITTGIRDKCATISCMITEIGDTCSWISCIPSEMRDTCVAISFISTKIGNTCTYISCMTREMRNTCAAISCIGKEEWGKEYFLSRATSGLGSTSYAIGWRRRFLSLFLNNQMTTLKISWTKHYSGSYSLLLYYFTKCFMRRLHIPGELLPCLCGRPCLPAALLNCQMGM